MDLELLRRKEVRFAVGLMSGTSCDGVDAALVRIKGTGLGTAIKLISFKTFPYPRELRMRLLAPRVDAREMCVLDFELGARYSNAAREIMENARPEGIEVDFIASAGHTMAHMPVRNSTPAGTLQIGESAVIAERCKVPVVSDFRPRDIAAGGQGAPLVPYADWILFHREDRTTVCLNLGGIANVTVVPPDFSATYAFDTGPANMAIDGAVRLLSGGEQSMDEDGDLAAGGVVVDEFLDYLLEHPYFNQVPPKSTGREEFAPEIYLRDALNTRAEHSIKDLVATVTAAVAFSIIRAHNRFIKPKHEVSKYVLSGGGAHNPALVRRIKQGLPGIDVSPSDTYGMPVDAKEAVAFAILGNECICGSPANVPGATGARHPVVLGKITPD